MGIKLLSTFRLAIFIGVFFTVGANPDLGFSISETNAFLECGGVVRDNSKQILYKMFDQVGDNERCVWIVATPYAASYNVRVSADFEFEDGFLNVGALVRHNLMEYSYEFSSTWTHLNATILIITFQSPQNASNRGFALEYEMASTTSNYSPYSSHSFISLDTLFLKFPPGRDLYDDYELSSLVYPLGNNVYRDGVIRHFVYKLISMEAAFDFVHVYSFNSAANQFHRIGSASGNFNNSLQFSSDDMIIVTFHSDGSHVGEGFFLSSVVANSTCTK